MGNDKYGVNQWEKNRLESRVKNRQFIEQIPDVPTMHLTFCYNASSESAVVRERDCLGERLSEGEIVRHCSLPFNLYEYDHSTTGILDISEHFAQSEEKKTVFPTDQLTEGPTDGQTLM